MPQKLILYEFPICDRGLWLAVRPKRDPRQNSGIATAPHVA